MKRERKRRADTKSNNYTVQHRLNDVDPCWDRWDCWERMFEKTDQDDQDDQDTQDSRANQDKENNRDNQISHTVNEKSENKKSRKESFLKNNGCYFVWFGFNFIFTFLIFLPFIQNFIVTCFVVACLYAISISFALSPSGEHLLRQLQDMRPILTNQDKNEILPIFNEVYETAREQHHGLSEQIQIFVIEDLAINAFAVGKETVAVTRGLLYAMESNYIKGIIAHEIGHIAHGDTKALLLTVVGNGIFSVILSICNVILKVSHWFLCHLKDSEIVMFLIKWTVNFLNIMIRFISFCGEVILALNSRYSETLADDFAVKCGYGDELANSLYMLDSIAPERKMRLIDKLKMSHPILKKRIQHLENLEN